MKNKRRDSFIVAVDQRDLVDLSCIDSKIQPSKSSAKHICPNAFKNMVNKIADNFLDDPRDRKFYADNYRCWPPPIFIISVTLIELAVFTYYSIIDGDGSTPKDDLFVYRPDKRQEIWRFAFYMVIHAGWAHLFFNLVIQLLIGLPLEMVHGSVRIGVVYMAGVLAGSLGTSVFDPNVYLLGASGGVYALLSAHLANVVLNYNQMEFGLLRIFGLFVIASTDFGYAVYERYVVKDEYGQTSYVAHFAGAAAGLTLGLVVLKNFEQKLHEQFYWWLSLTIYLGCMISAIIFNVCI